MPFDGEGIIRAASQLDVAISLGSAARSVDVPLALGRGAAKERIANLLVQTADWSSTAAAELDDAPSALMEVRNGLRNLADQAEAAHASRPWKARSEAGFTDAVQGARLTRQRIGELVGGAEAIEQGRGREWILEATSSTTSPPRVEAARDLMRLGELDELSAAHPFIERLDPLQRRSIDIAHTAIDSGIEPAGRMLVTDLGTVSGSGTVVKTSDVRLALDSVGAADRAPIWLGTAGETISFDPVHGAGLRIAASGDDAATIAANTRSLLATPLAQLDSTGRAHLAAISELPEALTAELSTDTRTASGRVAEYARSFGDSDGAVLGMWKADAIARTGSPTAALEEVLAERSGVDALRRIRTLGLDTVDAARPIWQRDFDAQIASIADDTTADVALDTIRSVRSGITAEQASTRAIELARTPDLDAAGTRELASLSMLPADVHPAILTDATPDLLRAARGENVSVLGQIRWKADEQWIRANPTEGRAFVEDEVRRIAAMADSEVTAADYQRLANFDTLPDSFRSILPPGRQYSWADLVRYGYSGSYGPTELDNVRYTIAAADIAADPAVTAESLRAETRAILAKADSDISPDDMRRLHVLRQVAGEKSPGLPAARSQEFDYIARASSNASSSYGKTEVDHLRTWLARTDIERDPAITADSLLDEVRTILAKPEAEVTAEDIRRIGILEGVTGEKALHLPDPRSYSFSTIGEYGWGPTESYTKNELKQLRTWLERGDIARDPAITAESLLGEVRTILAKPETEVTAQDIRRIAVLEGVTGEKALNLPSPRSYSFSTIGEYGWSPTESYTRTELSQLRTWLERGDIARDPDVTPESLLGEVRTILAKPDAEITADDIRRIAVLEGITGDKALHLPDPRSYSFSTIGEYGWAPTDSYTKTELRNLRTWLERGDIAGDPNVTADSLRDEVRTILAKPDAQITADDIRRIGVLEGITGDKALHLPDPQSYSFTTIGEYGWGPSESYTTRELANLRTWLERGDIARDANVTAESLQDEVRAILAKPNAEITRDDLRRIAVLEGVTGDKSLGLPAPRSYSFSTIRDSAWESTYSYATNELEHLRTWLQGVDIARDPAVTAETLRAEAAQIALLPPTELTSEHLRRLHALSAVPGAKAPGLPAPTSYSYEQLAEYGPSTANGYIAPLREWALVTSPAGLDEVAAQLRAGKTVSPTTLAMLASRQDELVARGVDVGLVLDSGIASLRAKAGSHDQTAELTLVKNFVAGLDLPPELRELQASTLDMAQRNLDRMAGRLHDGYSTYAELGEMGRIIENAELLGRVSSAQRGATSPAAAGAAAATGAVDDAARAGEQLTW